MGLKRQRQLLMKCLPEVDMLGMTNKLSLVGQTNKNKFQSRALLVQVSTSKGQDKVLGL